MEGISRFWDALGRATAARIAFAAILLVFMLSRFVNIGAFPIFNDEAIYIQYAQTIHMDFGRYAYVSMYNIFNDWKPPLQYWIGSVFIDAARDPLVPARAVTALVSVLGLAGVYFAAKELYGRREALFASLFFAASSLALLYSMQFTAEAYVFSATALFYACMFGMARAEGGKRRAWLFAGAAASGAALLLFKQSGALPLYLGMLVPLLAFAKGPETKKEKKKRDVREGRRRFWNLVWLSAGVIAAALAVYHLAIPAPYFANEAKFTSGWVMGLGELFGLPLGVWGANLAEVGALFTHYYGVSALALLIGFFAWAVRSRDARDILLSLLFLGSSAAILFLLKDFNEYMFNTATIVFFALVLGRIAVLLGDRFRAECGGEAHAKKGWAWWGVWVGAALLVATACFWTYQSALVKGDPVRYLEQATAWAKGNYLTGWSSGFGVKDVVAYLAAQRGPGTIVVDPQWGNPGTAVEVYGGYYPDLTTTLMPKEFLTDHFTASLAAAGLMPHGFLVYSEWFPEGSSRLSWKPYADALCASRKEFFGAPGEPPIAVCSF